MIVDTVKNLGIYAPLSKGFAIVDEFCKANNLKNLPCTRYDLADGVFANVSEYCPKDCGKPEAHREYCDLQLMVTGSENIAVSALENCSGSTGYNPDAEFFTQYAHPATVELNEGIFAFFAPQDAHLPCINNGCDNVKKIVFKIPVNL